MINIDFKTKNGMSRRVTGFFLSVLLFGALSSAQASTLKSVQANALSGDSLEVRLTFSGAVPEVKGYGIEKPARIALDLIGADSVVDEKRQNMGAGNVRSVTIVEAKDRTRLIFNLDSLAGYSTNVDGDTLVVLIGDNLPAGSGGVGTASDVVADAEAAVTGVDFRRGDDGEGRVLVKLSQASIPVDVQESGDKIVARFVGAGVSDELVRKLDVTDFATPVKLVETKALDGSTTIEIQSSGAWEYLAYQADELFSINVKPVSNDAAERKKQDAFEYTGEKLSLNFQDIEVRSVLQLIADFTGLNLVASDTVDGRITLRLQNVPWDQALELILKTKGLDKRKVGNVLLVAPADEIAAREQLELESQKQIASLAPLRTQYVNVNYANAAEIKTLISGADKEVGSLLSERGSVVVDKRTNTLIIQDTQARLNDIGDLIEQLDIPVQQVLIEARGVVASNDVSKEFGVRWGGLGYDGSQLANEGETSMFSGRLTSLRQLHYANIDRDDDGSLGEIEEFNVDTNNDLIVDLGVESSEASRFAVGFTSLASGLIELELSALEAEGHGELAATPKVLTADQQPAVIAAGQRVPYETATSSGATAVKFIDAELRLEVTPHITPDDNIIMTLKVFNDAISGFVADTPVVDTNRVETSVLVSDGETVVLGGIFQQEKRNSVAKTPFLGDLPWIGKLFSRTTKVDDKQELLIFITPRLMKDALANR